MLVYFFPPLAFFAYKRNDFHALLFAHLGNATNHFPEARLAVQAAFACDYIIDARNLAFELGHLQNRVDARPFRATEHNNQRRTQSTGSAASFDIVWVDAECVANNVTIVFHSLLEQVNLS